MPGFWIETGNSWTMIPLDDYLESGRIQEPANRAQLRERQTDRGAFLLSSRATDNPVLVVGSDSGAHVNGSPLPLGIRVLRDRDEIFLSKREARLYYTDERPANVVPFPGTERQIICPRCTTEVSAGHPSVQCPNCRLWYHQSADLPCWAYAPTCAKCDQSTDMDGGYAWTPEDM